MHYRSTASGHSTPVDTGPALWTRYWVAGSLPSGCGPIDQILEKLGLNWWAVLGLNQ